VQLVKDRKLRDQMGNRARETVRQNFLMTRYLEQYLDPFNAFETDFRLSTMVGTVR
jgi:trehalose synthase